MVWQKTLARAVDFVGIGLHGGQPTRLSVQPAPAHYGLRFVRTDLPGRPQVMAHYSRVVGTLRATTLGEGEATVATVEHLLAALWGLGVDNALILVDSPEIPIMDGSAASFARSLGLAGLRSLPWPRSYLVIRHAVELREDQQWMRVAPGRPSITYQIDFSHPMIRRQRYTFRMDDNSFRREIAPARTFGFLKEVEHLRAQGLAQGGSLDNALVLDEQGVLNPEGLRFPEECVRHKILDALGDLALLGLPLVGRVEVGRGSHALHHRFLEHLMRQESAWQVWTPPMHNREFSSAWGATPAWEGAPA